MKGILLAGGTGSRLRPLTWAVCKQLLPVHDKPMVYYALSSLMLAGIRDILVISTSQDLPLLRRLLGHGGPWGLRLSYAEQASPRGIAEALLLGETFLAGQPCMLVLGDNLLFGQGVGLALADAAALTHGAQVFGYRVADPRRYGVVDFGPDGAVRDLVEKPVDPPSPYAVPGVYAYDGTAAERVRELRPSPRGELEITDLNRSYLSEGALAVVRLGRGVAWLDMGTPDQLAEAANFVRSLEARTGLKVGCPQEIAWRQGWIDAGGLLREAERHADTAYGQYLADLAEEAQP